MTLRADPYTLEQALGTLIRNALEAMAHGGELAVRVRLGGVEPDGAGACVTIRSPVHERRRVGRG